MSITDELRKWARGFENVWVKPASKEIVVTTGTSMPVDHVNMRLFIEGMLDRIDAEHEAKVSYWQDASYKDGYDEGFASADDYFTDKRETLEEHGWVKLPVDADGEPIHVGDRLTDSAEFKSEGVVESLMLEPTGWSVHFGAGWADERIHDWHHHYPPTVEDVLFEACKAYHGLMVESMSDVAHDMPAPSEVIAEHAAKLRLAGEGE